MLIADVSEQLAYPSLGSILPRAKSVCAPAGCLRFAKRGSIALGDALPLSELAVVAKPAVHGEPADRWLSGEGGVRPVHAVDVNQRGSASGRAGRVTQLLRHDLRRWTG
jgi:hypothetical protein